jgi:hypothetical protein
MVKKKLTFTESKPDTSIRLDLGAGHCAHTPEGFTPIDIRAWKGVQVVDLRKSWPWKSNSVDEVHSAMLIQYLTAKERIHFFNELHRVLKSGAKAQIATPMWSANKAYIDLQAQWPPVVEGFYHTLNKDWRAAQDCDDVSGLKCHFDAGMGYGLHPAIIPRNQEYQQDAVMWSKEAAQDLIVTLTKR